MRTYRPLKGTYDPGWPSGIGNLAHEIVHVVQYSQGMSWASYLWSTARHGGYDSSPYEMAAEAVQDLIQANLIKEGFKGCPKAY